MDPLSLITAALVAGATAAVKSNAEQLLKDAYSGLKSLIKKKWAQADLEVIEREPASKSRQAILKESLQDSTALQDREVLEAALELLRTVEARDPAAVAAGGLRIDEVHALGAMSIDSILATPGGTHIGTLRSGADMKLGTLGGMGETGNP
ncbi:MAG TPA: hypothetical protein VJM53_08665, partial [Burkholderiales bacterium]|nr:hypothetical protein [Burkholderiales bacterium]